MVGFGRRVETIQRLGRDTDRGIESKCNIGSAEIIVNRFRYANHRAAFFVKLFCNLQRTIAADDDQSFHCQTLGISLGD